MKQPFFISEDFINNFDYNQNGNFNKSIIEEIKKIIISGDKFIYHQSFEYYLTSLESYMQPDFFNRNLSNIPKAGSVEIINLFSKNPLLIIFIHYSHPLFKKIAIKLNLFSKLEKKDGFFIFYIEKDIITKKWIIPIKQLSLEKPNIIYPIKIFQTKTDISDKLTENTINSIYLIFKNITYFFNSNFQYFFTYKKYQHKINTIHFKKFNNFILENKDAKKELQKKYEILDSNIKKTYNRSILKYDKE